MTPSQEKRIKQIREMYFDSYSFGSPENYEIKYEDINDGEYFVSFVIEVGRKNDGNSMASLICRDRDHFFIYKRGRVEKIGEYADGKVKVKKCKNIIR